MRAKTEHKAGFSCVKITFSIMLGLLLLSAHAGACTLPVYRYALENWPPDAYRIAIFHDDALTTDQQKVVDYLVEFEDTSAVVVDPYDLSDEKVHQEVRDFWASQIDKSLPRMIVRYPYYAQKEKVFRSLPVEMNVAKTLMESPKRREIARKILDGDCAVWVFVEGNDKQETEEARKELKTTLALLQGQIELPQPEPPMPGYPEPDPGAPTELHTAFSIIEITKEEKEDLLIELLRNVDDRLLGEEYDSQPMTFPIFGRGRALCGFAGAEIEENNIADASYFLTNACSCQIKSQNPGMDILMPVFWDDYIAKIRDFNAEFPPLQGITSLLANAEEAPTTPTITMLPSKPSLTEEARKSDNLLLVSLIVLGGLFIILLVATMTILKR